MPLKDPAAQAASLDNDYGATKGPQAPGSLRLRIFIGDPLADGYEMPDTTLDDTDTAVPNGYAPVVVPNDGSTWQAANPIDGSKTSYPITLPDSTYAWPDTGTHWQLEDADTGVVWDCCEFAETDQLVVDDAGFTPRPVLTVFYNNLVI